MRNRVGLVALTAVFTIGVLMSSANIEPTFANNSLEQRIQKVQQERSQTQQEVKNRENELTEVTRERSDIEEEIRTLDLQMGETHNEIRSQENEIAEVNEQIEQLKEELQIIEIRISERDHLLKDRARSMYQNGGSVNYLEVILGSKSFGDFLDRISALSMIAQQDRGILEAHIEDQRLVEETKERVEEQLEKLENYLVNLESLMAQLDGQKQQKDAVMKELLEQEEDLHAMLGELEGMDEILAEQEKAMKQELAAWQQRQRQAQQSGQPTTVITGNGKLLRPASGTLTSGFGNRVHPIYGTTRLHRGLDIANRTGTPIHASESGTVVTATYMSGYGNTVMISHNIDGQVMTTLYAHMSSIQVSRGQRVSRGQQIGLMGSTGASTGPHLHFEVHVGPWNGDANAMNPANYIQ